MPAIKEAATETNPRTVLEINVSNHAGVMSHIVGLFSRRSYNVEGILCMPVGDGTMSRIWLQLKEDQRLPQITKQVEKLKDVVDVRLHNADHAVFQELEDFFRS